MKLVIKEIEKPFTHSFTMFQKLDTKKMIEEKYINVRPNFISKTRLFTNIYFKEFSAGANWDIEGFKTVKKELHNYFSGNTNEAYYFKYLKSQGKEKYYEYVKEIINTLLHKHYSKKELDTIDVFTINIEKVL